MDCARMAQLAQTLVRQHRQAADAPPDTPGYRWFLEGAAETGFAAPGRGGDPKFASRSREWMFSADLPQLRRWMHTILYAERWTEHWPAFVDQALQNGQLEAFAERLEQLEG